jgi:hypothetical protein
MSVKVLAAYVTLALIIFAITAQTVRVSAQYVRDNTIPIGELVTVVEQVSLDGAQSVRAVVELGFGELTTQGGATDLLEATYTSNVTASLPTSTYSVTAGVGQLQIHHDRESEAFNGFPDLSRISEYQSRWGLVFSGNVPLDLTLIVGKGTGDIDLNGLNLTALRVDMGQGDVSVDLRGEREQGADVQIEVGWGSVTVDLRGKWHEDANADISVGTGEAIVLLPSDIGVVIHVDPGIGGIDAEDLTQDGDQYVNDAYGKSNVTLEVELSVGVGGAELKVPE